MSLFYEELKKIWQPVWVILLLLIGVIYYIGVVGGTGMEGSDLPQRLEVIERFGPTLEADEIPALLEMREDSLLALDAFLQQMPEAKELGLTESDLYFQFVRGYDEAEGQVYDRESEKVIRTLTPNEMDSFRNLAYSVEQSDVHRLYAVLDGYIFRYMSPPNTQEEGYSSEEQLRLSELKEVPWSLFDRGTYEATTRYIQKLTPWVVLSVILLLAPTYTRDLREKVRAMQWSSRWGRQVLHVQMAAGLVSAWILTMINVVVYSVVLASSGALGFQDCPIFFRNGSSFPWFDLTYGQYLMIMVVLVSMLGIAAGALALFFSQYSSSYVPMLLKAIPLFLIVGVIFGTWITKFTFFIRHGSDNSQFYIPKGIEAICVVILLVLSLSLCVWTCFYQRRRELN